MIKNFLFQKLEYSSSRYFYRFFGSFYRRGGAAISDFRGGLSLPAQAGSPPQAAKCVRTTLRIDHQTGNCKQGAVASLRSATKS